MSRYQLFPAHPEQPYFASQIKGAPTHLTTLKSSTAVNANSGCFSMYLAAILSADKFPPTSVKTSASVHLGEDDGPKITSIDLNCEAEVPGLDADKFAQYAQTAKEKCPISRLFAGTEINLSAKLIG